MPLTLFRRMKPLWYLLPLLIVVVVPLLAQDDCPDFVETTLVEIDQLCADTARNQACYANDAVDASVRGDARFETTGDLVAVDDVERLALSPFDAEQNVWGVVMMRLQANLPDTTPGQAVTMLLIGDVQIENRALNPQTPRLSGRLTANVILRAAPSLEAEALDALQNDTVLSLDGRTDDLEWLRVATIDGRIGWVFAELITVEGDVNALTVRQDLEPDYSPMQAFYFTSGVSSTAGCETLPDSGIMVQTPEGTVAITLNINDVTVSLSSTAFLQAQPETAMTVAMLEGQAVITAEETTVLAQAGTITEIPLDTQGAPSDTPTQPRPYTAESVERLPVRVLPREFEVAPPLVISREDSSDSGCDPRDPNCVAPTACDPHDPTCIVPTACDRRDPACAVPTLCSPRDPNCGATPTPCDPRDLICGSTTGGSTAGSSGTTGRSVGGTDPTPERSGGTSVGRTVR